MRIPGVPGHPWAPGASIMKTLLQLREGARERADLTNDSAAISDALANEFVNEAWHELYDLIVDADDAKLFAKNATNPPSVGTYSYRLPYDFYRLVSLHVRQGEYYIPGTAADPAQYAELADNQYDYSQPKYFVRWDINTGERFVFVFPAPKGALAVTYFPQPKILSLDSDSLDNPASWLEFVMVGAAVKMLVKIERDASALMYLHTTLAERIEDGVNDMDFNGPRRIRDIADRYGFGGGTFGGAGGGF